MRVVHVTPTFFDARRGLVGGGERFVSELARAMARHADVRILAFGAQTETLERDGVTIHVRRPLARGRNPINPLPGLLPELRGADVVHVHQPFTLVGAAAILSARRRGAKAFLTDLGGGGFNVHDRLRLDRHVAGYLCISELSARLLESRVAPKRVVYAGIDPDRFRPLGLPRERKVVAVGRIMPHKGQADVVRAVPDDVDLEVYGPVLDAEYAALARRLAEGKRVRFVHDATTDDLVRAYNTAALTVQASAHHTEFGGYAANTELFGLTLAESMACETPVVATRAGAMPEVAEEGVTGLIVPPREPDALREAMLRLLDDPEGAREMGKRGRARVLERFTWDAVARRCLEAYEEMPRVSPHA
ncbi:MAG TPA: glycosyltransferase family 4 protein [Candidatus Thermoplasmatota archaeon]|nr:glycosyltransferase family 4 protein [Candidatus Thermoplasmatota archaeon]